MILWLVALLPARGWAVAAMSAVHIPAVQAGIVASMPCHGEVTEPSHQGGLQPPDGHAATGEGPDPGELPEPTHSCASCDLCHSQLATSPGSVEARALLRPEVPAVMAARDTGRLLAATLERPPRA